jgi:hypothetical protein
VSDDFYAKSSEAKALHAVIDGEAYALDEILGDYSASELRELGSSADRLSRYCYREARDRD